MPGKKEIKERENEMEDKALIKYENREMTGYLAFWMQFYRISDQAAITLQYIEPTGQIFDIRP